MPGVNKIARPPKFRSRNKTYYRVLHWPIWVVVFFLAPGPLVFRLFAHGFSIYMALWLGIVMLVTAVAGFAGQLPGVEPRPYIIRFDEDRPNPLYRRICYTTAWGELIAYAILNWVGLVDALLSGKWHLQQIYGAAYFPLAGIIWLLGALGRLPRVKASTRAEGDERRFFYGALWIAAPAQGILGLLWLTLPHARWADALKLAVFTAALVILYLLCARRVLPRTLPVVPEFSGQVLVE
jgi:predicted small integral membrane protein